MRAVLVAPFTQLTFVSFDLQVFLFDVLHTTALSRVGHFVGMCGVTLFATALVAEVGGAWGAVSSQWVVNPALDYVGIGGGTFLVAQDT